MVDIIKDVTLNYNNDNLLNDLMNNGFKEINKNIYRKHIIIGYNIGMYITIGINDNFLNITSINEQFLSPYDINLQRTIFNENCIINYNTEINNLIQSNILCLNK